MQTLISWQPLPPNAGTQTFSPQLSMHDGYSAYMDSTLQLATSQGVVLPPRSSASKSVLSSVRSMLTFYLPDDDVGAILGKKGQNLAEIQQVQCA